MQIFFIGNDSDFRVFREMMQQFSPETEVKNGSQEDWESEIETVKIKKNSDSIEVFSNKGSLVKAKRSGIPVVVKDQDEKLAIYSFLKEHFKKELNWGILTGVKPVKLYKKIESMGLNPENVLSDIFHVKPEKVRLLKDIFKVQKPILQEFNKTKHVSLYIGIPICPQKCAYCSFVSTILDKKRTLLTDYFKGLKEEIRRSGEYLSQKDIIIDSVYIGGGTPSVLNAQEAEELIKVLKDSFDLSSLQEFTFEAGRPDTTSPELLKVLKENGVDRICLNPQTMNLKTLEKINRNHSPEDIKRVFAQMREAGFDNINMDLICGLEDESEEDFLRSLKSVIDLNPEDITIHDLSLKKGSRLREKQGNTVRKAYSDEFYKTVEQELQKAGYRPYYMYRQKYTIGNGENIGYCKEDSESIYNIMMMGEEQTIIGLGAGSTGKLYVNEKDQFRQVFTVKDIRTYNQRYKELIETKLNDYQNFFENQAE